MQKISKDSPYFLRENRQNYQKFRLRRKSFGEIFAGGAWGALIFGVRYYFAFWYKREKGSTIRGALLFGVHYHLSGWVCVWGGAPLDIVSPVSDRLGYPLKVSHWFEYFPWPYEPDIWGFYSTHGYYKTPRDGGHSSPGSVSIKKSRFWEGAFEINPPPPNSCP